jgi:hypothetical protein
MVGVSQVNFREDRSAVKAIKQLSNEWKRVSILDGDGV